MSAVRAGWTSASFLVYTGALTVLAAALWLNSILSGRYAAAAFVGWSALVLACAMGCAFALKLAERPLLAGLFAFVSVPLFAVFVAALEDWFGWLSHDSPLHGFHWGLLLLELLTVAAALWALRVFRHPLLVAAAAGAGWYFVADLLSSGGNWSAWVSLLYGLCLLPVATAVDRVYAFWLHVVSGLTIGGALLWFWHTSDWDFVLIGLVGLAYVFFGGSIRRSSWTVLGAVGLLLTTVHFIGFGESPKHDWARPLGFVVLGFVYVGLGILLWLREPARSPQEAPR